MPPKTVNGDDAGLLNELDRNGAEGKLTRRSDKGTDRFALLQPSGTVYLTISSEGQ